MTKIVDYDYEMIRKMAADREETEEELEKNDRELARNLSLPERLGSDADTETKLAYFAYEFCLGEDEDGDEVNGPPGEGAADADADAVNNFLEDIIQASKKICNAHHVDPEILTKVMDNLKNSIAAQEISIPTEKRAHQAHEQQESKRKRKRKLTSHIPDSADSEGITRASKKKKRYLQ